jgi:hypothetical protein
MLMKSLNSLLKADLPLVNPLDRYWVTGFADAYRNEALVIWGSQGSLVSSGRSR